jgi:hypothetical protein
MMRGVPNYFACQWSHDLQDEPVWLYEEVDDQRMKTRKLHVYRDGRRMRTDRVAPELDTSLSWVEIPPAEKIDAMPEFEVQPLTADEFEAVWATAEDAR